MSTRCRGRASIHRKRVQTGAAILTAMLLVTLVASMSAAALWQQWRGLEVEAAARSRLQSAWILQGALDWARLILREDARSSNIDHLAEPWALPLQEARLTTFLASSTEVLDEQDPANDAFLSGQIIDLQSRLNVTSLIQEGKPSVPVLRSFTRLFAALNLPEQELGLLTQNLQMALSSSDEQQLSQLAPLVPRSLDQLVGLGLSRQTVERLRPYVSVLPEVTPVNLGTASALVLHACIDPLSLADAQRLAGLRALTRFQTLNDAINAIANPLAKVNTAEHSVSSRYFEVRGELRIGTRVVQERSVVQRDGLVVKTLWRERGAFQKEPKTVSLQSTP